MLREIRPGREAACHFAEAVDLQGVAAVTDRVAAEGARDALTADARALRVGTIDMHVHAGPDVKSRASSISRRAG